MLLYACIYHNKANNNNVLYNTHSHNAAYGQQLSCRTALYRPNRTWRISCCMLAKYKVGLSNITCEYWHAQAVIIQSLVWSQCCKSININRSKRAFLHKINSDNFYLQIHSSPSLLLFSGTPIFEVRRSSNSNPRVCHQLRDFCLLSGDANHLAIPVFCLAFDQN